MKLGSLRLSIVGNKISPESPEACVVKIASWNDERDSLFVDVVHSSEI